MKKIKISGFAWTIQFVDKIELDKCDGITLYNDRKILVRNDLNEATTQCVLRHELTHAILCCQGRWSQKTFTQEEMCEFIAFQLPTLNKLMSEIGGR